MNSRARNRAKAGGEISAARMRGKMGMRRALKRALMEKHFTEMEARRRVWTVFGTDWM